MASSNTVLTPTIIAKEALMLLENNLVMGGLVYRAHENEFDKSVNGYKVGSSVTIRKPARYTVRSGAVATPQDSVEGTTSITVDTQEGVDLQFTSSDMTLKIGDFSQRFLEPAMIQLANSVDLKLTALYKKTWNWVGTAGTTLTTFAGFGKGPQRLDEMSVPSAMRRSILSPADQWGLAGGLTTSYVASIAKTALERAKLPLLGNVETYMTQNVTTHTVGSTAGTPLVNGGSQNVTYASTKDTGTQTLVTKGWTNSGAVIKEGDVFTISGVTAINPVTRAAQSYAQQFVARADGTADSSGNLTITMSPPMITSGAFQTVTAAPADGAAITRVGTAATGYAQNLVFHKNAYALVMVPMEKPQGAVNVARQTYNGLSARLVPYYDGTNDIDNWRLDILYGVKAIYPDLATRLSGT